MSILKRENTQGGVLLLVKLQAKETKTNTPPVPYNAKHHNFYVETPVKFS